VENDRKMSLRSARVVADPDAISIYMTPEESEEEND